MKLFAVTTVYVAGGSFGVLDYAKIVYAVHAKTPESAKAKVSKEIERAKRDEERIRGLEEIDPSLSQEEVFAKFDIKVIK